MDKWMIPVTVERDTGTSIYGDSDGRSTFTVEGALFNPGTSSNPTDQSAMTEESASLLFAEGDPGMKNGDRVTFTWLGENYAFTVGGRPIRYPMGTVVYLND